MDVKFIFFLQKNHLLFIHIKKSKIYLVDESSLENIYINFHR